MNPDGSWNITKMLVTLESIQNATAAGKLITVHAIPGPAGYNDPDTGGYFPVRGNVTSGNTFRAANWAPPQVLHIRFIRVISIC